MANIASQKVFGLGATGTTPTFNALNAGGDSYTNTNGNVLVHFKNTGTEKTVTFNSLVNCDQGSDHNIVLTVPATTGEKIIGPFPTARFNDANGRIGVTYSPDVTGLTAALIELSA